MRPMLPLLLVAALLGAPRAARASGDGPPDQAALLQVGFYLNYPSALFGPTLTAGIRLIDRLEIRLGTQFLLTDSIATTPGGPASTGYSGAFAFVPGLDIDLVRLLNNRVALVAALGLPLGVSFGGGGPSAFLTGFNAGLNIRYAPVPVFTISFEGGLLGQFTVVSDFGVTSVTHELGFYGLLAGTIYFGFGK